MRKQTKIDKNVAESNRKQQETMVRTTRKQTEIVENVAERNRKQWYEL